MNSFKQIFCIALLVVVLTDSTSANMRVCGKSLDQFLDMVCVNGFNAKNLRAKKFDPSLDLDETSLENDIQSTPYSSFFMEKLYGNPSNLIAKTRRRRHDGVAEECCRKSCTLPELLSYCQ